ncbi:MAG: alpha/beta hydrolase fold domain-containing protein [Lachnospiraceae bacterium]|nr:alpha/beta hydrolase fold domain-containing protein [Lachnospiraceae bacterium]MBP3505102.1 alpha/beta hydrolase fold domain-containing protein [Lachnospiraceae bacterium]
MKKEIEVEFDNLEWLYSQNWEYFDYGNCKRHLQVIMPYRRQGLEKKYPIIFYVPGASWHKQEMYNDIPKLTELAKKGFAIVSIQVRESDIAIFPAQIEDIKNAMECIVRKIAEFNLPFNMNEAYLMGHSSGGHLAMMAVLHNACGMIEMPKVKGVILESASSDILICSSEPLPPWMSVRPSTVLLGVDSIEGNEEIAYKASCVSLVSKDIILPPVLMFHCANDPVVSVENSRTLYQKLEEENHSVDYYEITDFEEHGGNIYFSESVLSIIQEFIKNTI